MPIETAEEIPDSSRANVVAGGVAFGLDIDTVQP